MASTRLILHPTDFSECSEYAFRLACALARESNARLVVLHVPQAPPATGVAEAQPTRVELEQCLQQVRPADTAVPVEHRLAEGDPVTEILAQAKALPSDLIVLGSHGRTGIDRLLMGSVAEQVVRRAPCPVLTVKVPRQEIRPPAPAAELR